MRTLLAVCFVLSLSACTTIEDEPERVRLGKADNVGSCENSCGGPAALGTCWCDDRCEEFGDCCDDLAVMCLGEPSDPEPEPDPDPDVSDDDDDPSSDECGEDLLGPECDDIDF